MTLSDSTAEPFADASVNSLECADLSALLVSATCRGRFNFIESRDERAVKPVPTKSADRSAHSRELSLAPLQLLHFSTHSDPVTTLHSKLNSR